MTRSAAGRVLAGTAIVVGAATLAAAGALAITGRSDASGGAAPALVAPTTPAPRTSTTDHVAVVSVGSTARSPTTTGPVAPEPSTTIAAPAVPSPSSPSSPAATSGRPPVSMSAGGVSAEIAAVGVLPDGSLQLPEDPRVVGWWAGSAPIGSGTTVLAGHVDSRRHGIGALAVLRDVVPGDAIDVTDSGAVVHRFVVTELRQTPKTELPQDLLVAPEPHLVLITCTGRFDERTRHYDDNLIVVAVPAPA